MIIILTYNFSIETKRDERMMIIRRLSGAFLLGLCALAPAAQADEPIFGYIYLTDLLPKDKWEMEQWVTDRESQAHGYFHQVEMSTEVEYGLLDDLQISLYANYAYQGASRNSVNGLTEGIDIINTHNPSTPINGTHWDGFALETTYRILSPYVAPVGLAFQVEGELGEREQGLELRGILQKNFLDDRLILGFNAWVEFEREATSNLDTGSGPDWVPQSGTKTRATYAEADLGASYRFAPGWYGGLEFRNHNEYGGYSLMHEDQDHTAFFVGPSIHYGAERWFATLAVLRQVAAIGYTEDQRAQMAHGLLFGDEHTVWDGIRFRFGYTF